MTIYCAEVPYQRDAARYFLALADLPRAVWLDSAGMARYDILSAAPQRVLLLDESTEGDPFAQVRSALGERTAAIPDIPFAGGALGYWSYDLARRLYDLPSVALDAEHLPDMAVGIYDWALVLDHQRKAAKVVSYRRFDGTEQLLQEILRRLKSGSSFPLEPFRVQGK